MSRRALTLSWITLSVLVACSEDSTTPTESGGTSALSGTVTDLIYPGRPVPGIAVASGSVAGVSGADGGFSLPGVSAPYPLVSVAPFSGVGAGTVFFTGYSSATTSSPVLGGVPGGWNSPRLSASAGSMMALDGRVLDHLRDALVPSDYANDEAELEGTISGGDAAGGPINLVAGDGTRGSRRVILDPNVPNYSAFAYQWPSAPTHTISVGAIQLDGSGNFRMGRVDDVELERATLNNVVNVAMNLVSGGAGQIPVSVSPPGGQTLGNVSWRAYVVVDGLPMFADEIITSVGSLDVPVLTGAQYIVTLSAGLEEGGNPAGGFRASFHDAEVGVAINEVVDAGGSVSVPADGSTDVSRTPTFEMTAPAGSVGGFITLVGYDTYSSALQLWQFGIPADAKSAALPVSEEVGARLHPAGLYVWTAFWIVGGTVPAPGEIFRQQSAIIEPVGDIAFATAESHAVYQSPTQQFETVDD